jgi:hypothetical protein
LGIPSGVMTGECQTLTSKIVAHFSDIIFKDPSLERLVRRLTANCYLRVTTWLGGLLLGRHK